MPGPTIVVNRTKYDTFLITIDADDGREISLQLTRHEFGKLVWSCERLEQNRDTKSSIEFGDCGEEAIQ